jgi:hypothetical protein
MTPKPARTLLLALFALALAALLVPAGASAAKKKRSSVPTVSSVAPMKLAIGDTLTIRGRNFRAGKNKNTVVFKRDGQRAVFVKAGRSTTRMLRVTIPAKLSSYLSRNSANGVARPTRFRLRVLSRRFGRTFTATKLSPQVTEAKAGNTTPPLPASGTSTATTASVGLDCNRDGATDPGWADYDGDLLASDTEVAIGTNPCSPDSDGDGIEDGWEYRSAYDLNRAACTVTFPANCAAIKPKQGETGYPNPLNGADASKDFDGDSLTNLEEFTAWKRKPGHNLSQLWYSGGLKASIDSDPSDGCTGITTPLFQLPVEFAYTLQPGYSLQLDAVPGCLRDDERDEDGDLLTNYAETHGPLSSDGWWGAVYKEEPSYSSDAANPQYEGTDWLTADSDNDGVIDGLDDQDNDGFLNIEEMRRGGKSVTSGSATGVTTGLWVQPFNPCLPNPVPGPQSSCTAHPSPDAKWPPMDPTIREQWPLWGDNAPYQGGITHLIPRPS